MKPTETHTRHIKWSPTAGSGFTRTCSSDDLPAGAYLSSYKYNPWQLTVDPEAIECFDVDDLTEIVQKLKQLNERDTQNGRNADSQCPEVEIPDF